MSNRQPTGMRLADRTLIAANNPRVEYRLYRTAAWGSYHHNGVQIRIQEENVIYHYSGSGVGRNERPRVPFVVGGEPELVRGVPYLYLLKFPPNAIAGFDEPNTFLARSEWRQLPRNPDIVFQELSQYGAHLVSRQVRYGGRTNSNTVFHDVLFITGGSLNGFNPGDSPGLRRSLRGGAGINDQNDRDPLDGWTAPINEDDGDDVAYLVH